MKLAVCIPSRGLIHSRTMEHVLTNLRNALCDYRIFFTHDQPIPDCFNELTDKALEWGADSIWFVEEDMLLPDYVLQDMINENLPVVTVDYPVTETIKCVRVENGQVVFCGTGCLLVKKEVFDNLDKPYFRSNIHYKLPDYEPTESTQETYGKHDVDFCIRVRKLGYTIHLNKNEAGQYRVKEYGKAGTNKGCHEIVTL